MFDSITNQHTPMGGAQHTTPMQALSDPGGLGTLRAHYGFGQSGRLASFQDAYNANPGDFSGFISALQGMRHRHDTMQPQAGGPNGPAMGGMPIPGAPAPNTQFPLNPGAGGPIQGQQVPGQVGTQLGVIGATPAGSPFGLPSY